MSKTNKRLGLSEAELKLVASADDGKGERQTEDGMFACWIAGARVEVHGPSYVVSAIAGAIYEKLKDF